jgi:hypothetical protein
VWRLSQRQSAWLIGVPDPGQPPPGWAMPLAPGGSRSAMSIAVGTTVVAVVVFIVGTPAANTDD